MNKLSETRPENEVHWLVLANSCIAQLVSVLGEHIFLVTALPMWAYDKTKSAHGVALALGAVTIAALFSLPAGAWTSRHSTRSVLLGCGLVRLLFAALILIAHHIRYEFGFVLACVFAISLVDSFFMPALKAAVPDWVPPSQLIRANGFLEATDIPAQLFGPLLGVAVYMRWGLTGAVYAQILTYALALIMLAFTRFPKMYVSGGSQGNVVMHRIWFTLQCAWRTFVVRRTLMAWTAGMAAAGVVEALILPFIHTELHQPESAFGLFGALLGSGMTLGALISTIWDYPFSEIALLAVSMGVSTIALLVFAHGKTVPVCGAATLVLGAGLVLVYVASTTIAQVELPEEIRAGMLGLTHSIEAVGLLIGLGFAGGLAARFGIRNTIDGAVGILLIGAILASVAALFPVQH